MSTGYYRLGANVEEKPRPDLDKLVKDAIAAFNRLSPEEQKAHRLAQQESWARGEKGMGSDEDEALEREKFRIAHTLTQHEISKAQGYTGDPCTNCQSPRVRHNGTCLLCDECGTTTGCS